VTGATLEETRAAKAKLALLLEGLPELRALGIMRMDGGFGLKVNLETATLFPIPADVDGVPVIVTIVGPICAL
jgi:hypothetical protein